MRAKLFSFVGALLIGGCFLPAQSSPQKLDVIEITQRDLFALHGWNSADVSVLGAQLGMTRTQVLKVVSAKGLILKCFSNGRELPTGPGCGVFFPPDTDTTVGFKFDTTDRISEIFIDQTVTYAREWNKHQISRKRLHGYTLQLVNHYTDALREKLFGSADLEERKDAGGGTEADYYYHYRKIGLTLHIHQLANKFRDLDELIFVPPQS